MDHFQVHDINAGVEEYQKTPQAKLIDVREKDEYAAGHIPASINIPLSKIESAQGEITDLDTPLFVYCRSGNRSKQAAGKLAAMGYSHIIEFGGIMDWDGEIEK